MNAAATAVEGDSSARAFDNWINALKSIRHDCIDNRLWPQLMNSTESSTHDMIVALDAEMTSIDVERGEILEVGAAVLTADLIPQASLHMVIHSSASGTLSEWSALHHTRPRYYECNMSLVDLCAGSKLSLQRADEELHAFLKVFQGGSGQLMSLCGNSVWRDYLFIVKHMPLTASLLHHRVIDCSGARELARRHCHVANVRIRPPKPLDVHCAMYDALDAVNFMRWHAHVTTHGMVALQGDARLNRDFLPAVLPIHAHRRVGFEAVDSVHPPEAHCDMAPFMLMPHDCESYIPEAMTKLLLAQQPPQGGATAPSGGEERRDERSDACGKDQDDARSTASTISWVEKIKSTPAAPSPSAHKSHKAHAGLPTSPLVTIASSYQRHASAHARQGNTYGICGSSQYNPSGKYVSAPAGAAAVLPGCSKREAKKGSKAQHGQRSSAYAMYSQRVAAR